MDLKNSRNEPAIGQAKRVPHWGVQSRFLVIRVSVGRSVAISVVSKCVGGIT